MEYVAWLVAVFVLAAVVVSAYRAWQIIGIILDYEDQRREGEE